MTLPDTLHYTKEHEWVRLDGTTVTIGITDYAQSQLGDIVFVELPEVDDEITQDEPFGTVEAVKAVSDLFAPVSGVVTAINEELEDSPEAVNEDPYGAGWMIKVEMSTPTQADGLLSAADYAAMTAE